MQTEDVVIMRVDTGEAVKSVADLKDNIKLLKGTLENLEIGTQDYQEALSALKINQNALKDAMYATSGSLADLSDTAQGAAETYNSLVHRMASLKEELRSTDVSTETGKLRFKELAEQVNNVNDRLKEMDALQGNYQRNVGNYKSALSGLGETLKQMPPTLGATKEKLGKVGETMQLVGKQPILGMIGLLAPIIMKITESLKDNETAMSAVKKATAALKPVFDLVGSVIEKIAGWVSKAVDHFVNLAGESGESFKKIIAGAVGVGNTIVQAILTPVRTTIEAFKGLGSIIKDVFTGNFKQIKQDAADAFDGIKGAFVKGFSFKDNFNLGKQVGEQFAQGLGESKPEVKKAGAEIGKTIAKEVTNELAKIDFDKVNATMDKTIAARLAARQAAEKEQAEIDKMIEADTLETQTFVEGVLADLEREEEQAAMDAEQRAADRIATLSGIAGATSSILGSIADLYEEDAENNAKSAKKAKAIRIASATIDTISGAIGAYMQSVASVPPPAGIILGAAQAAAVTAAGIAQIAKIKSTSISTSDTSGSSAISASVAAPNVSSGVQQTSLIRTATDEATLNTISSRQRVYILQSDIEAANGASRTRVAESTF